MAEEPELKALATNRRAFHRYQAIERLEVGIELTGTEVKSIRAGRFAFADTHGRIEGNELWLHGLHISPYEHGNRYNHDPDRPRRLLAHKKEILSMRRKVAERGLTLVPLRFYLRRGLVKVELALCRGKRDVDKREDIKRRDYERESQRALRSRR